MIERILILLLLLFSAFGGTAQSPKVFHSVKEALLDSANVKSLSITGDTAIKDLPSELLNLKNLASIDLESLPKLEFSKAMTLLSKLPNLKKIFISDCRVVSIADQMPEFEKLEIFDLVDDNLRTLPKEIEGMKNLKEVDISGNPHLNFGQTFHILARLPNLRELDLSNCKLSLLPAEIAELKSIEVLWLDDNKLTSLPKSIGHFNKLKKLSLFQNDIKTIKVNKGEFPMLASINLCYNEFEIFPVELKSALKLKNITIWNNHIKIIPKEIAGFKMLDSINMDDNNLIEIPSELCALKTLHHFSVRYNNLKSKSIRNVYKAPNLLGLGFDNNLIDSISPQIRNLPGLKYFGISNNPVKDLPNEFCNLKDLRIIGLNELKEFNWRHAFALMEGLPKLYAIGLARMGS